MTFYIITCKIGKCLTFNQGRRDEVDLVTWFAKVALWNGIIETTQSKQRFVNLQHKLTISCARTNGKSSFLLTSSGFMWVGMNATWIPWETLREAQHVTAGRLHACIWRLQLIEILMPTQSSTSHKLPTVNFKLYVSIFRPSDSFSTHNSSR